MRILLAMLVVVTLAASKSCAVPAGDPTPSPGPPGSSMEAR